MKILHSIRLPFSFTYFIFKHESLPRNTILINLHRYVADFSNRISFEQLEFTVQVVSMNRTLIIHDFIDYSKFLSLADYLDMVNGYNPMWFRKMNTLNKPYFFFIHIREKADINGETIPN